MNSRIYKVNGNYILRSIAGDNIIIPTGSTIYDFAGMIQINEAGAFLWKIMQTGATRGDMIDSLRSEYEIDTELAARDVDAFVKRLEKHGMLESE